MTIVFSRASQYIPPAALGPPPLPTTGKQTRIPHFFTGWRTTLPNLPLDVLFEVSGAHIPVRVLRILMNILLDRFPHATP